jgi:AraC-like DNA-binding protein
MKTAEKVISLIADQDLSRVRQEDIAHAMGMNRTYLDRRLRAEGIKYREIIWEERKRRCVELFSNNPHANGELVKRRCGYLQLNSSYRAFIQMFGCTVSDVKFGRASIS